jgi:hypothetical protein
VWYELTGQRANAECVFELKTRGHRIKEFVEVIRDDDRLNKSKSTIEGMQMYDERTIIRLNSLKIRKQQS